MKTKKNLSSETTVAGEPMRPGAKYQAYLDWLKVELPNRTWPERRITQAPTWCSVDLRDGNQALINPMDVDRKLELFNLLLSLGFKEIEIGFPSASQVEYDFARTLIDSDLIPDGVVPQVLTQAREALIDRTFEAIDGTSRAIVHVYNSTSELQRRVVFRKPQNEIIDIAVKGVERIKQLASQTDTEVILEYSPESFTGTELEFALQICEAVMDVWEPTPSHKLILNLPATVEMSTPNVYADQIEWFCSNIKSRDSVIISLHTHNDRGTAVAATELGLMAGADRVEGTLFGNGERTGNVDLLTLALNMYVQGVDPRLDLRDISRIRKIAESCTQLPVHQRHPYAGDLVFTAFSGSHQDAIRKGMKARIDHGSELWEVPYLPIDPLDIGSTYEAIVRINSQSGKGGAAYAIESELGCELPKIMLPEFSAVVQELTESFGTEIPSSTLWTEFVEEYLDRTSPYKYVKFQHLSTNGDDECTLWVVVDKEEKVFKGSGNGPIDACVHALLDGGSPKFGFADYGVHARTGGADAEAVAFIQIELEDGLKKFGVGIDTDTTIAAIKAIICALNRSLGTMRPVQTNFASHVMELELHGPLPQRLQAEFAAMIEPLSESSGAAVPPAKIWSTFDNEFVKRTSPYELLGFGASSNRNLAKQTEYHLLTRFEGKEKLFTGVGNGPINACVNALIEGGSPSFQLVEYVEHARTTGADAEAVCFIQIELDDGLRKFGVGIDTDTTKAATMAVISALNRSFVTKEAVDADAAGLLEAEFHCNLPRKLRLEFNATARQSFRTSGKFIPLGDLWQQFQLDYVKRLDLPFRYLGFQSRQTEQVQVGDSGELAQVKVSCELTVEFEGNERCLKGSGNGAIDACVHSLLEGGCPPFRLVDYHEHARSFGSDADAAAYIEIEMGEGHRSYGVGIDRNTVKAAIMALLTAWTAPGERPGFRDPLIQQFVCNDSAIHLKFPISLGGWSGAQICSQREQL